MLAAVAGAGAIAAAPAGIRGKRKNRWLRRSSKRITSTRTGCPYSSSRCIDKYPRDRLFRTKFVSEREIYKTTLSFDDEEMSSIVYTQCLLLSK